MSGRPSRQSTKRAYQEEGDESGSEESDAPRPSKRTARKTQAKRASSDSDSDNEKAEEATNTADGTGKRGSSKSGAFEAGQITSIYVENFMCHRKFSLNFGRHLNFITGRNGSGIHIHLNPYFNTDISAKITHNSIVCIQFSQANLRL